MLFPALLLLAVSPAAASTAAEDPLVSVSSGGTASVDDALARLSEHRRMLMIAAHPDDEDTFLLTLVEKGQHGEAAYLSLSRGDGGQNLIGDELGEGLGLLRSRELDAARRTDGAEQYFSRAYDFGYTRSLSETLERWPRQVLLEDAMRVLRLHRPQVLVSVFPPTPAAGHGQHQAAGWLTEELFELSRAAEDPFPELGLEPWRVESLFRAAWFRPQLATLRLPLGQLDAIHGRSIFQTALLSRSQHRCQDMGFEQPPGDFDNALTWLAGRGGESDQVPDAPDIFAGVDTRLMAIAETFATERMRTLSAPELALIGELAQRSRDGLTPSRLGDVVPPLAEIVTRLDRLLSEADELGDRGHGRALLAEKLEIARRGLAAAAGVVTDAITDRELVRPGERFDVRTLLWRSGGELQDVSVTLHSPAGWQLGELQPAEGARGRFTAKVDDERVASVEVPADAVPDLPYFMTRPRKGDLFDWSGVDPEVATRPFGPPPLIARFEFEIEGARVILEREVVQRRRDQAIGEVRRPLRVVPEIEVSVDRSLIVWPNDRRDPEALTVTVRSHLSEVATVQVEASMPGGWPAVAPVELTLDPDGRGEAVLKVTAPDDLSAVAAAGAIKIGARITGSSLEHKVYRHAFQPVDYGHIRPTVLPKAADTSVQVLDLALPPLARVAYVRGASDQVPELLAAVGVPIELLTAEELMVTPLEDFDAVVLGPRAYEVEPALAAANARVLDYARGGGLVIVQYQQYAFSRGAFAPLALEISRPHDRITDETSPVRLVMPDHPSLTTPNRLGEEDWLGWVQERGLYFAGTWDDAWQAPLALSDPDESGGRLDEQLGGLLIAELGEGHYVYTGLSFFRQLPAGVPGAYRLFGNLLAVGSPPA